VENYNRFIPYSMSMYSSEMFGIKFRIRTNYSMILIEQCIDGNLWDSNDS
jgi:hypothetical protein